MIIRQIATSFDSTGCYIIISNGLHPDDPRYFSKMIVCTRTAFNAMINDTRLFEKEAGVKISDGYQKAWRYIKNLHQVKVDIESLAKYVAANDIRAGREQDYIEAEKEMEALAAEQEKELKKEIQNEKRTETGTVSAPKKRTRTSKKVVSGTD